MQNGGHLFWSECVKPPGTETGLYRENKVNAMAIDNLAPLFASPGYQ